MQRQAMEISIKELRDKADELDQERKEMEEMWGEKIPITKKWLVNIVNETEESDKWKFE